MSDVTQRQYMVILRFCHPEAASPMTCRDKLWSFRTFFHPDTIVSDGTQRQIMVILRLLSSRGGEPDDMRRQIMVIPHTFCHPDTILSDGTQRQIMVILRLLSSRGGEPHHMQRQIMVLPHNFSTIGDNRVRCHAETIYGHSAPVIIQRRRAR